MATGMLQKKHFNQTANISLTVATIVLCFLSGLFLNGNIPSVTLSTLGQALVVLGYPISFLHEQGFNIYTQHIGFPSESPMSTMLAPALIIETFLHLGLVPQDAFSSAFIVFYALGFFGFYKIAREHSVSAPLSSAIALLWSACPIIWNSSGYTHLHFGLVALPFFYYLCSSGIRLSAEGRCSGAVLHVLSTVIVVFTDGYSFVFLATATSIYFITYTIQERRSKKIYWAFALHVASFLLAYFLFVRYVGVSEYEVASLDFFRGWGVDLSFLLIPTQGHHWLWDTFGLSLPRSSENYYGDSSVWISTFSAPLIVTSLLLIRKPSAKIATHWCYVAIAAAGLYMALGPSIKLFALKPNGFTELGMPAQYAGVSTGSAILSEHVPGLRNMRASYRWLALFFFGAVGIIAIWAGRQRRPTALLIIITIIILFIPNPKQHWAAKVEHRKLLMDIDHRLKGNLARDLNAGEIVAFLPWGNDFLVNYLAPSLNIRTYNIGGDKNVAQARKHWPANMLLFPKETVPSHFAKSLLTLLVSDDADAVVLTYIDYLYAAQYWPPALPYKKALEPIVSELKSISFIDVNESEFHSVIRLKPEAKRSEVRDFVDSLPFTIETAVTIETPRTTGSFGDGLIRSNGQSGFLHYGPYYAAFAGDYILEVKGHADSTPTAWIDVVSDLGTVTHGRFSLYPNSETPNPNILLRSHIHIPSFVKDLEVRVYAGERDSLEISGFRLLSLD